MKKRPLRGLRFLPANLPASLAPIALAVCASHAQAQTPPSYADMRTWQLQGVNGGNWVDSANISQPFTSATSDSAIDRYVAERPAM